MVGRGKSLDKGRRDVVKKKPHKSRKLKEAKEWGWFEFINYNSCRKPVIPVGSPFQAEIPDWTSLSQEKCPTSQLSDVKWLGTQVWPNKLNGKDSTDCEIGKGRPNSCECASPGSVECVKLHVADKKVRVQLHLGSAFKEWKFDEMGEGVSTWWTEKEQKMVNSVVRRRPSWNKRSILQLVSDIYPSRRKEEIVKYYFNVFVPRRIGAQTRGGCKIVDSSSGGEFSKAPRLESPQKRRKPNDCALSDSKDVQTKYLKVPKRMQVPRKHVQRGAQTEELSNPHAITSSDHPSHLLCLTS